MSKILPFPHDSKTAVSLSQVCYLALSSSLSSHEELRALSPQIMLWESDLWLIDLTPCLGYWHIQAKANAQSLHEHLDEVIKNILYTSKPHTPSSKLRSEATTLQSQDGFTAGKTALDSEARRPQAKRTELVHTNEYAKRSEATTLQSQDGFTAVVASTPWQALLLLKSFEEKGFHGLYMASSNLAQKISGSISWKNWWKLCERYMDLTLPETKRKSFHRHKRAMQITLRRLAIHTPGQAKTLLPASHIRRRFGVHIAEMWEASFGSGIGLNFPWQALPLQETIFVKRNLDFCASNWNEIEDFLRRDLQTLSLLESFKKDESILEMEWLIVLNNLQEVSLLIPFRHPHCIRQESHHQRTALLQIAYAFQKYLSQQKNTPQEVSSLIAWKLCITKTFKRRKTNANLFDEQDIAQSSQLLTLENQLDRPLESYGILNDWLPEDSFHLSSKTDSLSFEQHHILDILGQQRPLFILKSVQVFQAEGVSRLWRFRERTMDKWWQCQTSNAVRDYYQVLTQETLTWVFRDSQGQFFLHGIYG